MFWIKPSHHWIKIFESEPLYLIFHSNSQLSGDFSSALSKTMIKHNFFHLFQSALEAKQRPQIQLWQLNLVKTLNYSFDFKYRAALPMIINFDNLFLPTLVVFCMEMYVCVVHFKLMLPKYNKSKPEILHNIQK